MSVAACLFLEGDGYANKIWKNFVGMGPSKGMPFSPYTYGATGENRGMGLTKRRKGGKQRLVELVKKWRTKGKGKVQTGQV